MKTKRPLLALLIIILGTSTIGATYLIHTNDKPHTYSSSLITTISVFPTNLTQYSEIGKTFTVNITITNANNQYVWQAGMNFNATLLEAISVEEGPFLKQGGPTLWTNGTIDNTAGIIHYHACALAGNVTGVSGNGTLATITFKVKNYGNVTLQLTDAIILNPNLKDTDKTLTQGTVNTKIVGDINGDRKVDVSDLFNLGTAYGSDSSTPNWNPDCDFNRDDKVDESDLSDLSKNYGKTTEPNLPSFLSSILE
jgi:hypothetical protein